MRYQRYNDSYLEAVAVEIRSKHGKFDGQRLLIEHVADSLELQIIPVQGLHEKIKVEGFVPKRPKTIFVDQDDFDAGTPRYFFTVAEEIAHIVLHYQGSNAAPDTLFDWMKSLSSGDYNALERDAKHLAGAMLMPAEQFKEIFSSYSSKHKTTLAGNGAKVDHLTSVRYATLHTASSFGVNHEAAVNRARCLNLINESEMKQLLSQKRTRGARHGLPHLGAKCEVSKGCPHELGGGSCGWKQTTPSTPIARTTCIPMPD